MIAFLSGKLQKKLANSVVLNVGGIGYELFLSSQSLARMPSEGMEAKVHAYLHVREDLLQLYGFVTSEEKELFTHLISVGGIGPKVALSVLSTFSADSLRKAILTSDVGSITTIPGIGKKSAQRLILELKEKLALPEFQEVFSPQASTAYSEARNALVNLGYSSIESKRALEGFDYSKTEVTPEELVKYALKNLVQASS